MGRRAVIMGEGEMDRTLSRMVHQILERNQGGRDLVLMGIPNRGVPLAHRIARKIQQIEGVEVPVGSVDVTFYRDDFSRRIPPDKPHKTDIPFALADKKVILVDDVLYTGRTVRAALDALIDFGRPLLVWLAVLIDRGQRELPIRADFVGREVVASVTEVVNVRLREVDGQDEVVIKERGHGA